MRCWTYLLAVATTFVLLGFAAQAADVPKEGQKAPDITLPATQAGKILPRR